MANRQTAGWVDCTDKKKKTTTLNADGVQTSTISVQTEYAICWCCHIIIDDVFRIQMSMISSYTWINTYAQKRKINK